MLRIMWYYHNSLMKYIILVSYNHVGDYHQAVQMQQRIHKKASNIVSVSLVDAQASDLHQLFAQQQVRYLHALGQKAIIRLAQYKKGNAEILQQLHIIVQIHQHFDELLIIQPNILIMPKLNYIQKQELKQTEKILLTETIFQKLTNQQLEEMYCESIISKQLNKQDCFIIVMLSGDAPDQENMKYFTRESADELFFRLNYLLQVKRKQGLDYAVIVQNGPRTGKHDPLTGKEQCLHTFVHEEDPHKAVDIISSYFINKLKEQGIRYYFYNFSFQIFGSKRVVNSVYKPLLYLAQQPHNIFMFPMESVSMCSELPFYIRPSQLYAYQTSSTNQSHMKFVRGGYKRGLYCMFQSKLEIQYPKNEIEDKYDENEEVVRRIMQIIEQQNNNNEDD